MKITIMPARLRGSVTPPSSKSQSHRLLLAAALADGESSLKNISPSWDIEATIGCMTALGAEISENGGRIWGIPHPFRKRDELPLLDCGESGSTLRFLIPVALAVAGGGRFVGRGRLPERPQTPYFELFAEKGIFYEQRGGVLTVQGMLTPGRYALPGNVSSQFVTGLLYALPLLDGDSDIVLTSALESAAYVDMTLAALAAFGVTAVPAETGWHVPGNQIFQPQTLAAEGDWSQAAFYYAMNGLGSQIEILGLDGDSCQGDRAVAEYCRRMDAPGPVTLDVSQCPDLAPALAVRAALRAGEVTEIVGGARLRLKECDRIDAITTEMNRLGADIVQRPDSMTIRGVSSLRGGGADSHNDHRIAMMLAAAATRADGPVTIRGAESVGKSYPRFWADYKSLGGQIREDGPWEY